MIASMVVPLVSVMLAAQLITKREKGTRAMTLFYNLVQHVNDFMRAFFASASHARRMEEHWRQHSGYPASEQFDQLSKESVQTGADIRKAAATLEADCLMLKMLFKADG